MTGITSVHNDIGPAPLTPSSSTVSYACVSTRLEHYLRVVGLTATLMPTAGYSWDCCAPVLPPAEPPAAPPAHLPVPPAGLRSTPPSQSVYRLCSLSDTRTTGDVGVRQKLGAALTKR